MWPAIIAAAAATAQGAGNIWSGDKAARKAWSRAKEAAQNAHQWEVGDLRAAGLNPILSATGGSGATAQPFMATAPAIDAVSAAEKGMASAKAQADIENSKAITEAQVANTMASTAKTYSDIVNDGYRLQNETELKDSSVGLNASHASLNAANAVLAGANTGLVNSKRGQIAFQNALMKAQAEAARAQAIASAASARQSNANALGQEQTNAYYGADPKRIEAREFAKAYGPKVNTLYRATDSLVGDNGSFTNWFKGVGSNSSRSFGGNGFGVNYRGGTD